MTYLFTQAELDILRKEDPSNPGDFIGLIPKPLFFDSVHGIGVA
jgi:hypothetical protein